MYLTEQTQWKESFPGVITCWFSNCKATNYIPSPGNSVIEEVVPAHDSFLNWSLKLDGAVPESGGSICVSDPSLCNMFLGSQSGAICTHACTYMQKSCKSRLGFIAGHELREGDSIIIYSPNFNTSENEKALINNGAIVNDICKGDGPGTEDMCHLSLGWRLQSSPEGRVSSWAPIRRPALSFHHLLLSFLFALRNLASQESETVSFPVFSQTPLHWGTNMWPWFAHQTQSQGTWLGS